MNLTPGTSSAALPSYSTVWLLLEDENTYVGLLMRMMHYRCFPLWTRDGDHRNDPVLQETALHQCAAAVHVARPICSPQLDRPVSVLLSLLLWLRQLRTQQLRLRGAAAEEEMRAAICLDHQELPIESTTPANAVSQWMATSSLKV